MPQMAPLQWLSLYTSFVVIFMMLNALNYFSFSYLPKIVSMKKSFNKINWKW